MEARGQLVELVPFFHPEGPGDGTQVISLGVKCFCLLSHLSGLRNCFVNVCFVLVQTPRGRSLWIYCWHLAILENPPGLFLSLEGGCFCTTWIPEF